MSTDRTSRPLPAGAQIGVECADRTANMPFLVLWARPGFPAKGIILSSDVLWCNVHYNGHGTDLCLGPACKYPHPEGAAARSQGFVAFHSYHHRRLCVLTFPGGVKRRLDDLVVRHGRLCGLDVRLVRDGTEPNDPVTVECVNGLAPKLPPTMVNLSYAVPMVFGYDPPADHVLQVPLILPRECQQREQVRRIAGTIGRQVGGEGGAS